MHNTRERRLGTLAFERKDQSVQLNFRNIGRLNDAILPNIRGTNLKLSFRRFCLLANASNLSMTSNGSSF